MSQYDSVTITVTREQAKTLKTALILETAQRTLDATALSTDDPRREGHWLVRRDLIEVSEVLTAAMYPKITERERAMARHPAGKGLKA